MVEQMAELNVKLLNEIKTHILAEPRRLMMGSFLSKKYTDGRCVYDASSYGIMKREYAPCGTAACIAGWAVLLTDGMDSVLSNGIRYRAADLLGIPAHGFREDALFEVSEWPARFTSLYRHATDVETLAQVTAERIDFFIATNGTDEEVSA